MRYVAALVIALMTASTVLLPEIEPPTPGPEADLSPPPLAICPMVGAGDRTTEAAVLSSINGSGRISTFSSGAETSAAEFVTGNTGSVLIPADDLSVVGLTGGLVEFPSESTAAGVVVRGETSASSETCVSVAPQTAFIAGGTTASGAQFSLQLVNPYAGPATAEVTVISESGVESNSRFGVVTVPPLSSVTLNMAEIIPGRETIAAEVVPTRGSVFAFGHQRTEGRSALWSALEPRQDWWLPVPEGGANRELIVSNPLNSDVEFQVDLYGPEEFVEGFTTGVIPALGETVIPLDLGFNDEVALRVIATGPVAATLKFEQSRGLSISGGSSIDATSWLLPGAESPVGGEGKLIIFNNGIEEVDANVRALGGGFEFNRTLTIPGGMVEGVVIVEAEGYRVDATGPVVVAWVSLPESGRNMSMGVPVIDG